MDYYQILGVDRNSSQEDIKRAYRRLSRKYHPDNAGEQAREKFDRVQEAYTVLGDEEKRALYDQKAAAERDQGDYRGDSRQNENRGQTFKQDNNYGDMAAFFSGEYKNSFDKFFKAGLKKTPGKDTGARPVNTDKLFESFFKYK